MLESPPECGVPCGTCEALAHDNARLKEENERLVEALQEILHTGSANWARLRADKALEGKQGGAK